MGARTGQEYLDRLGSLNTTVQIGGETLSGGIPDHPAFRNLTRTYARLYDLQHAPEHRDVMTYQSPTTGDRVGTSFMVPRTAEDLVKRREAFKVWADDSLGTLGRTGDYLNSCLMALSEAGPWFAQADPAFADNVKRYYEMVREQDLLTTHTLIPPQANRSQSAAQQGGGKLMAHIVKEDDNGIVVRGARLLATIGPTADELLVFPSTVLKGNPEDAPYSFAFAINCDAPGLRFVCRESMDHGRSHFDHPLGSRFEEMDAVVVFDDVHVPWEKLQLYRDVERCNQANTRTGAVVAMAHQVVVKNIAKSEFVLGLAALLVDTIGAENFQHVQEKLAELWVTLETMRALLRAAEADAALDEWGVMRPAWNPLDAARNLYPRLYPRMIEIVQQLGASGLVAMPTEQDLKGPLADDIRRYYQAARADAFERVPLFKLAWDVAISAFAGRQVLYERFFFGDPVRMAGSLVAAHDAEIRGYAERVRELVLELRDEAFGSEK
jgi:4-hydroxyphenylacetate 3-monooxygenase